MFPASGHGLPAWTGTSSKDGAPFSGVPSSEGCLIFQVG